MVVSPTLQEGYIARSPDDLLVFACLAEFVVTLLPTMPSSMLGTAELLPLLTELVLTSMER